jgi:hypothetical protein
MATFALSLPILLGCVGLATDYSNWSRAKAVIQSAADQSALAAARELRLGNSNASTISQVAQNFALAALASGAGTNPTITTQVASDQSNVTVTISQNVATTMPQSLGLPFATVRAKARARVLGGKPLCMLALHPKSSHGLQAQGNSHVTATGCAIYSNSTNPNSLWVSDTSVIDSASICSAGGYTGSSSNFTTLPQTDCPVLPDPLASRPAPTVGSTCDYTNLTIEEKTVSLLPGTYCGGITVTEGGVANLQPGVYIINNGNLSVNSGSSLIGANVGFFLTGKSTSIAFTGTSTIDLTAPASGIMAGILFWEDPTSGGGKNHTIGSSNARNLLGTLYFPQSALVITSPNPVAAQSAYTIVVADHLDLTASPNLYLNSNYASTNIPVPAGVGPSLGSVLDQ